MARERNNGQIALNGLGINIKESLRMVSDMAKEYIVMQMEVYIRGNGMKMISMARVFLHGETILNEQEMYMREIIGMIRGMDMGFISMQVELYMMDSG